MEALFIKLLNMSITASYLLLLILILRAIFPKAPRVMFCTLWAMAALRLLIPVSFDSILSLIPSSEPVPPEIIYSQTPVIQSGFAKVNHVVNPVIQESFIPETGASVSPIQILLTLASWIWGIGVVIMVLYACVSYLKIRKRVSEAVPRNGIYTCDHIDTPFILGLFRPKIYLPSDTDPTDQRYVVAHEMAHLSRKDHFWKPLGYLLLSVYWFNPLMWISYISFSRDIELACDEKVIRSMGKGCKKAYSEALINCSAHKSGIAACPLAFGETGVKQRVKSVLHYRKPTFWVIMIAVIACILAGLCFLTNPKGQPLSHIVSIDLREKDINLIQIESSDNNYEITSKSGKDQVLDLISQVKISKDDIIKGPDKNQAYTNTILFDFSPTHSKMYIHFSEDFESVWVDNNVKPTDTYRVYDKKAISQFFASTIEAPAKPAESNSWGLSLELSDASPRSVCIRFLKSENTPAQSFYDMPGYTLEQKVGNTWQRINTESRWDRYVDTPIDFDWYSQEGNGMMIVWDQLPPLTEGTYRIGTEVVTDKDLKNAESIWLYSEFTIGPEAGALGMPALEDLPKDYTQEKAAIDGCLVMAEGITHTGLDLWNSFYNAVMENNPASIRLCKSKKSGDIQPIDEIYDITFDGTQYHVSGSDHGKPVEQDYTYLMAYQGEDPSADYYDRWENVVLTNETVSWDQLQQNNAPYLVIYQTLMHTPTGLPFPEGACEIRLEFEGKTYVKATDQETIQGIKALFREADYLQGGAKTHGIGIGLDLIVTDTDGNFVRIELDPENDICRVGEDFFWYGKPDEASYHFKLWNLLGIYQWPQELYAKYPSIRSLDAAPLQGSDLVRVSVCLPSVSQSLPYASTENFTGQVIYDFKETYLRYGTVQKLAAAVGELEKKGLGLLIWDGFRPVKAQNKLWEICPDSNRESSPTGKRTHCRGMAVDVTLVDLATGEMLPMPSGFDDFTSAGDRDFSECTDEQRKNAELLTEVMRANGFQTINSEWWHFYDSQEYPIEETFVPSPSGLWEADCEEFINLRRQPGGDDVILTIPKGDRFSMLAWAGKYALIDYQGVQGWVHTGYIRS